MASRYWVGGGSSTNWSATGNTNWAATSGGANNQSVPGTSDDVFFDASSGSGTSTISANITTLSFDANGYTGTLVHNSGVTFTTGSSGTRTVRFGSGMTYTLGDPATSALKLGTSSATSTTITLTTNGKTLGNVTANTRSSSHSVTLQDNLVSSGTLTQGGGGALNLNGFNVTAVAYDGSVGAGITTLGTGTVTLTGTGTIWNVTTSGSLVASTSTIKITDASASDKTFTDSTGTTYNNIWYSPGAGTGKFILDTSTATYNDIKFDGTGAATIQLKISTTLTVSSLTLNGHVGALLSLISSSAGTAATISKASGTVTCDYLSIKDNHATGGATFLATHSTDVSGNTGWSFAAFLAKSLTVLQAVKRAAYW